MAKIGMGKKLLCLTFQLEDDLFALDVARVREVLDYQDVSRVPGMPDFMRGVINVRGQVVPVMDLRLKFGMTSTEVGADTRVVVMEVDSEGTKTVVGALADAVHDVAEFDVGMIEPPPGAGIGWRNRFIAGIGKRDDHFYVILDADRVYSTEELDLLESKAEEHLAVAGDEEDDNNGSDSLDKEL